MTKTTKVPFKLKTDKYHFCGDGVQFLPLLQSRGGSFVVFAKKSFKWFPLFHFLMASVKMTTKMMILRSITNNSLAHVKNNTYFCRHLCDDSFDGKVHKDDKEDYFNQLIC